MGPFSGWWCHQRNYSLKWCSSLDNTVIMHSTNCNYQKSENAIFIDVMYFNKKWRATTFTANIITNGNNQLCIDVSRVLSWHDVQPCTGWLTTCSGIEMKSNTVFIIILGRNGIYFTWVAASYRGEARGLWINASPRERSLVKFHLSEFRIWNG